MRATFLITIETDGDTDLIGIADDINTEISKHYQTISVAPWHRKTLGESSPTPPVVTG